MARYTAEMVLLIPILSAVLIMLAVLQVLWGIGFWFPIADEALLTRTVIGFRGQTKMPGAVPCALVAVALLAAAMSLWGPHGGLRTAMIAVVALVFFARGIAAYVWRWRWLTPEMPFARLDRWIYGPLCLVMAAGFAAVGLNDF